jgi:hypothetical protein
MGGESPQLRNLLDGETRCVPLAKVDQIAMGDMGIYQNFIVG